jgi:hypothetical protein
MRPDGMAKLVRDARLRCIVVSPSAEWAVEAKDADSGPASGLIEQWDSMARRAAPTPEPGVASYSLNSTTTDGSGSYWAVESYRDAANVSRTLTARCP